jgi:hypothetical protein
MKILIFNVLLYSSFVIYAAQTSWLSLESEGVTIQKLYGLTEGDYLTVNLFSVEASDENNAIDNFYRLTDRDVKRLRTIFDQYHVQLTTIPGLSVITTMRSCANRSGKPMLIHYHGFFIEDQQQMWFVRTELNNRMSLLIDHYGEILDHVLAQMKMAPE